MIRDLFHHAHPSTSQMKSIRGFFPTKLSANIGCNKYPVAYADFLEYSPNISGGPRSHFRNTKTRNEKKVKKHYQEQKML